MSYVTIILFTSGNNRSVDKIIIHSLFCEQS